MVSLLSRWVLELGQQYNRPVQLLIDVLNILICFVLALMLRLDRTSLINFFEQHATWYVLIPVIPLSIVAFKRAGLYLAIIQFMASRAIKVMLLLSIFSGLLLACANFLLSFPIPKSVPIIYSILLFFALFSSRYVVRATIDYISKKPVMNGVIYGAGDAGQRLLAALNGDQNIRIVAFVDDNVGVHGRQIDTITIYPPDTIEELKQSLDLKVVLLATPSAKASERKRIISMLEKHALQVRSIPSIKNIVAGRSQVSDLEDIGVEDLLAREAVAPLPDLIAKTVKNKSVMITGAGGSIGSELCRQIIQLQPAKLLIFDISEIAVYNINQELMELIEGQNLPVVLLPFVGSVQNQKRIAYILKVFEVETVFHAAANKHVPLVEQNVIEGILNNVFGTKRIVEAAIESGVETFTLISTDKAVRPTNFMGASKRLAELICQANAASQNSTHISIVRFGNVMWSSGSVLPRFKEQIMRGGPVTVTHPEITRYFMTIPEAAQLVLQASSMSRGGEVFVLDMGEPIKILDVAKSMVRLHGMLPQLGETAKTTAGEITIKFSGLRPGEKLYEELLIGDEAKPTIHPRILSVQEAMMPFNKLYSLLDDLQISCDNMDVTAVKKDILRAPVSFYPQQEISDLITKIPRHAVDLRTGKTKNNLPSREGAIKE